MATAELIVPARSTRSTWSEYSRMSRAKCTENAEHSHYWVKVLLWLHLRGEIDLAAPMKYPPGEPFKVIVLAARRVIGVDLFHPNDCSGHGDNPDEGDPRR